MTPSRPSPMTRPRRLPLPVFGLWQWQRLWMALALAACAPASLAQPLPDAAVTQYDPKRVQKELTSFEAIGDGIVLTLATCEEEPHCATAMSRHELERLLDRIQQRIDHLRQVEREGAEGLSDPYARLLEQYERLRSRYAEQLGRVQRVTQRVDIKALEQDWEELLSFEAKKTKEARKPEVPAPNRDVTLKRFADVTEPIPID